MKGCGYYTGTVSNGKLKADIIYTVTFKDGEEYNYSKGEIKEFVKLQDIPVGEVRYQLLCKAKGDYFSCEVEKIIFEQHVLVYPLLEEIDDQKKDRQCWVLDNRQYNYSLGQIEE